MFLKSPQNADDAYIYMQNENVQLLSIVTAFNRPTFYVWISVYTYLYVYAYCIYIYMIGVTWLPFQHVSFFVLLK